MSMARAEKELKGHHVLAMIVAFFGVIFGVNFLMAYLANATWSGLVVENGYVASQSFNSDLARAKAQEALGWNVGFSHDRDSVTVAFADAKGASIDTLNLTGRLQRTVTDRQDQQLTFAWMGSGLYSAPARLGPGLWEVEIDGKGGGVAGYHKIFRFVVNP
ncbi:MAG: FixH family protein [Aestuariivirga sp.]|uniref:FixH family protein n=1 Tax=Aestuariivirga sp. TaxID=2650926 RepID=UPI0025C60B63|nr:FixH family protein [Aestuariivirga sp.]MCA3560465.1 FixH family protein [Aestuariivirga sp.]